MAENPLHHVLLAALDEATACLAFREIGLQARSRAFPPQAVFGPTFTSGWREAHPACRRSPPAAKGGGRGTGGNLRASVLVYPC
jgi:hypothetical protein